MKKCTILARWDHQKKIPLKLSLGARNLAVEIWGKHGLYLGPAEAGMVLNVILEQIEYSMEIK